MSLFSSLAPSFSRAEAAKVDNVATKEVPVDTIRPRYEVNETEEAFGLTVYLPGVARDGLDVSAEAGEIRVIGRRAWKRPEGWTTLHRETADSAFELVLSHDNAIDIDRIHAELADGVLRVSLPKAEAIKPRKITVS